MYCSYAALQADSNQNLTCAALCHCLRPEENCLKAHMQTSAVRKRTCERQRLRLKLCQHGVERVMFKNMQRELLIAARMACYYSMGVQLIVTSSLGI